ncbi:hypothetical protein [Corynebacterium glyciniphilum]|uniref:Putative membrane protein n=1 Tax=Corynebacterium glyciniphilum AJ 3170 TaxID=1404245 RepID=X5EAS0_9CORY|nr:hypothetical protein [Corynebacterium glyciniphilum]AHW64505.1 Putative membrane protein [Corynebacterium glyciniphilum AJ 3170]
MTDGIEQWVLDLPLWLQTPLTLVVLVLLASLAAVVMIKVAFGVLPVTEDEERAFASVDDPSHEEGDNR